jgi:methylmalonyl-CoA/ethylmalonyl-CoA epimerase
MFHLDHLGILVASLEESVPQFCAMLGYPADAVEYHEVPSEGVRIAMLKGNTTIELLEPTEPEGALARFMEKRGPGFHHWCFRAPAPLEDKLAELKDEGLQVLSDAPKVGAEGRIFFVHPKSAGGILTEFVEEGSGL